MAPKKSKATKKVEEAEEASAPGPEVVKKKRGRPAGVGGTKKKKGMRPRVMGALVMGTLNHLEILFRYWYQYHWYLWYYRL